MYGGSRRPGEFLLHPADLRERALEDRLAPAYASAASARRAAATSREAGAPVALTALLLAYFVYALAVRFASGLAVIVTAFAAYSLLAG
jgi:hypothetical protein